MRTVRGSRARAADDACDILSGSPVPVLNTLVCRVCVSRRRTEYDIYASRIYMYGIFRFTDHARRRPPRAAARRALAHTHTRRTRPQTRRDAPATRDAHRPAARQRAPPGPAPGHPTGTPRHATFRQPSRAERGRAPAARDPDRTGQSHNFLSRAERRTYNGLSTTLHRCTSNRFTPLGKNAARQ